ncbi:MAG: glutathione synthase [Alphaproteobacteria bacterium]|nr:glutathione synthase [Alphaproteobacteria bacterium]
MKVAVQMDPLDRLNLDSDSTICLIKEAISRNADVYSYTPNKLTLNPESLCAVASSISIVGGSIRLSKPSNISLESFDVLLMRQDPPVDMRYLTYTYMLDSISDKVLIVNSPRKVRDMPEKLFALSEFSEHMPDTIVSESLDLALDFLYLHNNIIIKPLYGHGGEGIKKFNSHEVEDFKNYFESLLKKSLAPVMLQKFLENISQGDKRVILIDGKIAGAMNRIPPKNSFHANMVLGGVPEPTELTKKEKDICQNVGKELKNQGIIFAGLDIIDEFLTEINITSPTGIKTINDLYGFEEDNRIEAKIWDVIEQKLGR